MVDWFKKQNPPRFFLVLLCLLGYLVWVVVQQLVAEIPTPTCGVSDRIHDWTKGIHQFFVLNPLWANGYLIISSLFFQAFSFFLIFKTIFGATTRPFLSLVVFLVLRQLMQALVSLPLPEGIIWRYPGVPGFLFVNYNIANDLFFSSHTGLSVLALFEIITFGKKWLTWLTVFVMLFEISATLLLRFHYTMDVYAGIMTALVAHYIALNSAPYVDRFLIRISDKIEKKIP